MAFFLTRQQILDLPEGERFEALIEQLTHEERMQLAACKDQINRLSEERKRELGERLAQFFLNRVVN